MSRTRRDHFGGQAGEGWRYYATGLGVGIQLEIEDAGSHVVGVEPSEGLGKRTNNTGNAILSALHDRLYEQDEVLFEVDT